MQILGTALKALFISFFFSNTLWATDLPKLLDETEATISKFYRAFHLNEEIRSEILSRSLFLLNGQNTPYQSPNGRPLFYLYFEAKNPGPETKTVFWVGGVHPDEFAPSVTTWLFLEDILNERVELSLEHHLVYVPFLNPDGLIDGLFESGYPTRTNAQGVDLNRAFYDRKVFPKGHSTSEVEFLMDLMEKYSPDYLVAPHAALFILDLDGNKNEKRLEWINHIFQATGQGAGPQIPIKDFQVYAPPGARDRWSLGKFITELNQIMPQGPSCLTFEFGGPIPYPTPNDPHRDLKVAKRKNLGRFEDNGHLAQIYYGYYFYALEKAINFLQ